MAGKGETVIRTILEIDDPAELRPPADPPRRSFELERVDDPAANVWFYETVGPEWGWTDRLRWTDRQWVQWAERVETTAILIGGERAGYFELEPGANAITIAYFGLLDAFHGLGIGGHALTAAIRRGFELAPLVQVSTLTTDGPHALANYLARGMRVRSRSEYRAPAAS